MEGLTASQLVVLTYAENSNVLAAAMLDALNASVPGAGEQGGSSRELDDASSSLTPCRSPSPLPLIFTADAAEHDLTQNQTAPASPPAPPLPLPPPPGLMRERSQSL